MHSPSELTGVDVRVVDENRSLEVTCAPLLSLKRSTVPAMTTRDDQQISQILAQMSATPAPPPPRLHDQDEDEDEDEDALPVPPPPPPDPAASATTANRRRAAAAPTGATGTGPRARGRAKSDERLAMRADEWEQSRKLNHVRPSLSLSGCGLCMQP